MARATRCHAPVDAQAAAPRRLPPVERPGTPRGKTEHPASISRRGMRLLAAGNPPLWRGLDLDVPSERSVDDRFRVYVSVALRHAAIDRARAKQADPGQLEDDVPDIVDDAPAVDEVLASEATRTALRERIKALPSRQRAVIELRLEGFKQEEIAAKLGMNKTTVFFDIQRATKALATPPRAEASAKTEAPTIEPRKRQPIMYEGREVTMRELADRAGVSVVTLKDRMKRGMTLEQAMTAPRGRRPSGKAEAAAAAGVSKATLWRRMKRGMTLEQAVALRK